MRIGIHIFPYIIVITYIVSIAKIYMSTDEIIVCLYNIQI